MTAAVTMRGAAAGAVTAALMAAPPLRAQDAGGARALAERVARAGDGEVRFAYATRPGVCGDGGRGVTWVRGDDTSHFGAWYAGRGGRGAWACEPGPARVALAVRGGVPRRLRLTVGGRGAPAGGGAEPGVDLGVVAAGAAAAYLLDLAARSDAPVGDGPAGDAAVLAAVVADAGAVWPRLVQLARAAGAPPAARRAATFWTSQFACDAVRDARARRGALTRADTADREVRRQVVFALSQRRGAERAGTLARVARADPDPAVRCAALFWLGQGPGARTGDDPATLALFEGVLRAP